MGYKWVVNFKVLDLFSGIGGFSLGLERAGMHTVAFCENDPFCRKVIEKHWSDVPIHENIEELNAQKYRGTIDLVCGGFPCQPFSVAGEQRGAEDNRALWPEMLRVVREVGPSWVIGENVAGIINMELDNVLSDLEGEGYACQAFVIPACGVDAHHRRDRVWIVGRYSIMGNPQHNGSSAAEKRQITNQAHNNNPEGQNQTIEPSRTSGRANHENVADANGESGRRGGFSTNPTDQGREARRGRTKSVQPEDGETQPGHPESGSKTVADANGERLQESAQTRIESLREQEDSIEGSLIGGDTSEAWRNWPAEPDVGRVAHGISGRVDRLKSLGNAVVPQVVEVLGKAIMKIENKYITSLNGCTDNEDLFD